MCLLCNKSYSCKKCSTTGLSRHLSSVNKITRDLGEGSSESSATKPSENESRHQNKKRMRDEENQEDREGQDIEEDVAKMILSFIRSRLSAKNINALSTLRSHFLEKA